MIRADVNGIGIDTEDQVRVDMTAMIDVIFTVIAFMMIVINVPIHTLNVDVPESDAAQSSDARTPAVLHVLADDKLWRVDDGDPLDRASILEALRARQDAREDALPVLVSIDEQAPVQRMVETFSMLQAGGFEQVSIIADTAEGGAS